MKNILHFMNILRLSDEVIRTYGRFPDERAPGLQGAREIYRIAFSELVRQGMPYTRADSSLKIETDGEVYAIHERGLESAACRQGPNAAAMPAFPYPAHYENEGGGPDDEDEGLDETRVMSFQEAMGTEEADRTAGPESMDEEYVQPAGYLLEDGDNGTGISFEGNSIRKEEGPPGEREENNSQENEGGSLKQPMHEAPAEDAGALQDLPEEDGTDAREPETDEDPYEDPYEDPEDEGFEEPGAGPEEEGNESDGIIIPPEEDMADGPKAAEEPGEHGVPGTNENAGSRSGEDDEEAPDADPAGEGAPQTAISRTALQDALHKDDFTYSNGRIIIKAPNGAEEKAAVLSMPLPMEADINDDKGQSRNPVYILHCVIAGKDKKPLEAFTVKGQGETILRIAGYEVAFSAWTDAEGEYRTGCRLDRRSAAIGTSLSYKVRAGGRKGHIVLGDEEGTIRIHAMPTNFSETEKGQPTSMLYYIETADEESFDVARPQSPIRFPYGGGYMKALFVWKDGILNGGIIGEK